MFVIVKTTMFRTVDSNGDMFDDFEDESFVRFTDAGYPMFSETGKLFETKDEAKAILNIIASLFDNSKRTMSRVHFDIKEVKENDKYCRQSAS